MNTPANVAELSEEECWERLSANSLGRLATAVAGNPDIFPVNYYADGKSLLIRTAPGTKLLELTIHHDVAFEIDGYTDDEAWSVIVKGAASELEKPDRNRRSRPPAARAVDSDPQVPVRANHAALDQRTPLPP